MASLDTWTLTKSDMEYNYDIAKVAIFRTLVEEGLLTTEEADEWCAEHTIILSKKSIFRTITDRWKRAEGSKDNYVVKVVRSANG